jgi:hypothetical protein
MNTLWQRFMSIWKPSSVYGFRGKPDSTNASPHTEGFTQGKVNTLRRYVKLLAEGDCKALIVLGLGGVGKTYHVVDTLERCGYNRGGPRKLSIVKGFTSPKGLYRILYENRDSVIVFDDCDAVLKNAQSANLLKAVLDSYDIRVVTWASEAKSNLPRSFVFSGKCCFISNYRMSEFPQPILSRCNYYELHLDTNDLLNLVYQASFNMPGRQDLVTRSSVLHYITLNYPKFADLNIRTYIKLYDLARMYPNEWKHMADTSL